MKIKQQTSWWVDTILFIGFWVAFFLSFTGVELHQWIGVFGGVLAACHLLVHWEWVRAVSKRSLADLSGAVLLKLVTDGVILGGFVMIIITGLIISTWLNLSLSNYSSWLLVHILVSITTLLALVAKLGLHWRWISRSSRGVLLPVPISSAKSLHLKPAPRKRSMDRRDFLKVMGVVSGGSLVALLSATKSLAALQSAEATSKSVSENSNATDSYTAGLPQSSANLSTGGTCSIQCGKRCSYPGQCRWYSDEDNDNRCDFGECA